MCQILHCETARPSRKQVRRVIDANPDGTGVAWIHGGVAQWRKGLADDQALDLSQSVPLPFALHARVATSGGTSSRLTHPFPVSRKSGLSLAGSAPSVLMHNGIWSTWDADDLVDRANLRGPVSDTRLMAYLLSRVGGDDRQTLAREMVAAGVGRLLVIGPDGMQRYGSWTKGGTVDGTTSGIWYSSLGHCPINLGGWDLSFRHLDAPLLPASTRLPAHYAKTRLAPAEPEFTADTTYELCTGCEVLTRSDRLNRDWEIDGDKNSALCVDCLRNFEPLTPETAISRLASDGESQ